MSNLKKYAIYLSFLVGGYILSSVLIFIGLNVNYQNISLKGEVPEQISIEKAEANKEDGRIYGYVSNNRGNNVNGKYIKISIYDGNDELLTTEYLKVNDVEYDNSKMFKARFTADRAVSYSISIVENEQS